MQKMYYVVHVIFQTLYTHFISYFRSDFELKLMFHVVKFMFFVML